MRSFRNTFLAALVLLGLVIWAWRPATMAAQSTEAPAGGPTIYLPIITAPPTCPASSGNSYSAGTAYQFDLDNPVRPAALHADKNLDLRGYAVNTSSSFAHELVNYGSGDPTQPPQLATAFSPNRVPPFAHFYRVYNWNWAPSPAPGSRGTPINTWPVTAIGFDVPAGETIRVPSSGYNIGGGMEAIVLYADANSVALRYAREDTGGGAGYTVHIDGICTDPNLLALYNQLDAANGPRYQYVPPANRPYSYDLPNLPAGKPVGVAGPGEVVLAIVDSGGFMDTRSCNEWWQIRPGYGGGCPPP